LGLRAMASPIAACSNSRTCSCAAGHQIGGVFWRTHIQLSRAGKTHAVAAAKVWVSGVMKASRRQSRARARNAGPPDRGCRRA
jgi:hypothetical protein